MNHGKAIGGFARSRVAVFLPGLLIIAALLIIPCARGANTLDTNVPSQWPLLSNLVAKWDAISQAEVERAAERGELTARHYLGYCYTEGHRFGANTSLGLDWYERAAKDGYLPSIYNIGTIYERGLGVTRDVTNAVHYYEVAAQAGYARAQYILAKRLHESLLAHEVPARDEVPPDIGRAIFWYRRAAAQNYSAAAYELGRCYLWGHGVARNEERAVEFLRQAADAGDAGAAFDLAAAYSMGIGEPRNDADRPNQILLRLIADNPANQSAYDTLIFRYQNGFGGPADLIAAADFYCRAARAGVGPYSLFDKLDADKRKSAPHASFTGDFEGHLLSPNTIHDGKPEAEFFVVLSLYLQAAKGDGPARLKIGGDYLSGRNVPKSPARAWAWFTLAAERNAPDAARKAAEAKALMTPDELRDADGLPQKIAADLAWVAALIGGGFSR